MKRHIPIMVKEILSFIPDDVQIIVDGTFGHGGHTIEIVKSEQWKVNPAENDGTGSGKSKIIGMERDPRVLEHGKAYLEENIIGLWALSIKLAFDIQLFNDSYANIAQYLPPGQKAGFVLLDLGINREHVTDNERWFSIQWEWPLDMRFTPKAGKTAYELIKWSSADDMAKRFMNYADFKEKRAVGIATTISNNKSNPKLDSTLWLIEILKEIKIHRNELAPLFQAIRIMVNHEFDNIELFIKSLDTILEPGGRCAIMTFHSIEDRIIKNYFKQLSETWNYTILTKHVIAPHYTEVQRNKASRSAKLRVIEKNL